MTRKLLCEVKIITKHTSNSLVLFVTHKRWRVVRPLLSAVLLRKLDNINEKSAGGELGVRGHSLSLSFSSFPSTLALPSVTCAIQTETTEDPDESTPWNFKLNKQIFKVRLSEAPGKQVVFSAYELSLI